MPHQGKEKVVILERLMYCPKCKEEDIISPIKRLQYEKDSYWVLCTRRDCSFLEEYKGKAVVNKDDLIINGLPGQLIQHMDIFYEDINKIVRLCMSEYIKIKYVESSTTNFDLEATKDLLRDLCECHGLECADLADVSKVNESLPVADEDLVSLNQPGELLTNKEDLVATTTADPCGLACFCQLSQPAKPHESNKLAEELIGFNDSAVVDLPSQPTDDDLSLICHDLSQCRFDNSSNQPMQPSKMKDSELTFLEDQKKFENVHQLPKFCNLSESLRELAETLVADLPIPYQEEIKMAFSQIEGYNFPEDFAKDTTPDKLPLLQILEEGERQQCIKAETDALLKDFMADIDGFNLLL